MTEIVFIHSLTPDKFKTESYSSPVLDQKEIHHKPPLHSSRMRDDRKKVNKSEQ
jgi:hypothetical protein